MGQEYDHACTGTVAKFKGALGTAIGITRESSREALVDKVTKTVAGIEVTAATRQRSVYPLVLVQRGPAQLFFEGLPKGCSNLQRRPPLILLGCIANLGRALFEQSTASCAFAGWPPFSIRISSPSQSKAHDRTLDSGPRSNDLATEAAVARPVRASTQPPSPRNPPSS